MSGKERPNRNWPLTLLALGMGVLTGFGAVICWLNLGSDGLMWTAAIVLTGTSLMLFIAALSGKAEDFFLALIGWW